MYIVTDSYSGISGHDSVYVISPTGEITKYMIAAANSANGGVLTHYKQLNVILNSVISLGYKQMDVEINNVSTEELYYFAKQWTSGSSELHQAKISQLSIKGFPNPTNGIVNIELSYSKGFEPKEIVVINEGGFIIYTKQLEHIESGETVSIDLSNQKSGLYLITAKNSVKYSPLIKVIRN